MRNARQHILDLIDVPDKHQEHAKKLVVQSYYPIPYSNVDLLLSDTLHL